MVTKQPKTLLKEYSKEDKGVLVMEDLFVYVVAFIIGIIASLFLGYKYGHESGSRDAIDKLFNGRR